MGERAQLGPTPTWLPMTLIGGAIVILVGAEVRDRVAAAPFDEVEHICGLCHVDWRLVGIVIILGVSLSALTWAGLKYMPRGV